MLRNASKFSAVAIRAQFPIFSQTHNGKPLVYLDNGATAQKPLAVIEAVGRYYRSQNANIHRAVHRLAQVATDAFESARVKVQRYINAASPAEVIFTKGTTDAINLVAHSLSHLLLREGDEILLSRLEHHSNIVPWQMAAQRHGASIRVLEIDDRGEPLYEHLDSMVTPRTRIIAMTHLSNALGTIVDHQQVVAAAGRVGAKVLLDGAQWAPHFPIDVSKLGADFYVFSGHKVFGPTGVGVLWGRRELLEAMPPYQGGGDMIRTVDFGQTTYAEPPNKFEAGTPDIAGVVGLATAIDWLGTVDLAAAAEHEHDLLEYATAQLGEIAGLQIVGTAPRKASVVSMLLDGVDPHTLGTLLDADGVAVRTGHHCCMPLMTRLGIPGTARASMAMYNTRQDIDALVRGIRRVRDSLSPTTPRPVAMKARHEPNAESVVYPSRAADSPAAAAAVLIDDFELFDDWEQKHQYLIELGQKIPPLPQSEKTDRQRVPGCQSTVYLTARRRPGSPDVLDFAAESDAFIVNGLIALLERVFSGQRAEEILMFDVEAFFERLGLSHHLTMGRRNGLASMVQRIRGLAGAITPHADPEAVST